MTIRWYIGRFEENVKNVCIRDLLGIERCLDKHKRNFMLQIHALLVICDTRMKTHLYTHANEKWLESNGMASLIPSQMLKNILNVAYNRQYSLPLPADAVQIRNQLNFGALDSHSAHICYCWWWKCSSSRFIVRSKHKSDKIVVEITKFKPEMTQ